MTPAPAMAVGAIAVLIFLIFVVVLASLVARREVRRPIDHTFDTDYYMSLASQRQPGAEPITPGDIRRDMRRRLIAQDGDE